MHFFIYLVKADFSKPTTFSKKFKKVYKCSLPAYSFWILESFFTSDSINTFPLEIILASSLSLVSTKI